MSIGGSSLGTLLVQRLDAALGATLSQQSNIVSGARPDAIKQPGEPSRPDPAQNETGRHPRESVDRAMAQTEQRARPTVDPARLAERHGDAAAGHPVPNADATSSAPTTLGFAAKTILALLAEFPDRAPAVVGRTPLSGTAATPHASALPQAPPGIGAARAAPMPTPALTGSAPAFAQALALAVQGSGLFYESHLNNLAFGKQGVATILSEPQALLARAGNAASGASPAGSSNKASGSSFASSGMPPGTSLASAAATSGAAARIADGTQTSGAPITRPEPGPTSSLSSSTPAQQAPTAAPNNQPGPLAGLHPDTHLLVRQQLDVLANQAFVWRGQAWPDVPMHWEIERREPSAADADAGESGPWSTRLTVSMPNLGVVQARIEMTGQQLVVHLAAAESAERLNQDSDALRSRFQASGLRLGRLAIDADMPPDSGGPS